MAVTYSLGANPFWYFADKDGKALAGGKLYSYSNLNPTFVKYIYQDPNGLFPYPDPIILDSAGTTGPLYFQYDSTTNDTYYLELYDANGVLIRTMNNYTPGQGSGGGGVTVTNLENYLTNNQFWRNFGGITTGGVTLPTFIKLAPGNHDGFASGANTLGYTGPDIIFTKSNTSATDTIQFKKFTLGSSVLTGDVTPEYYLNYSCTNTPTSETYKYVQIPITRGVQNLNNQNMSFLFYAKCNSGNAQVSVAFRQFYGDDNSPVADTIQPIGSFTLSNQWVKYQVTNVNVPDATGKSLGNCYNDALFLLIQYPLGASTDIDITKPALYLGNVLPSEDFEIYDKTNSIIAAPRTGDIKTALETFQAGYVQMNDGTIGDDKSNGTARAITDTYALFNLIWNSIPNNYAPIYNSDGTTGTRGATSYADYLSHKSLSLPKALGRVLAGADPAPVNDTFTTDFKTDNTKLNLGTSSASFFTGNPVRIYPSGADILPAPLVSGRTYYAISIDLTHIKIAANYADAVNATPVPIVLTDNGTGGPFNIQNPWFTVGQYYGEEAHVQTLNELASHTHTGYFLFTNVSTGGGGIPTYGQPGGSEAAVTVNSSGNSAPANVIQPTLFMNYFIKL